MSKKSSSGVIQLSFCDITPHSRLRRDTMPYTDLSYYKLSVHLQVGLVWSGLVWPERLQARHRVLAPFFCHKLFNSIFPVFQKGSPRPLIVAVEFTCGTKPRGSGGAPTWEGEPQGCPGAGMGGGGGTPSFLAMAWLYRWIALGLGCPSTGKGLWLYLKRWSLSPVNTMLLEPVAPAPGGKGSGWAGARTPATDEEPAAWPGPLNTSLRAWGGRPPPNMWPM